MADVAEAILKLRPNALWELEGFEYSGLIWKDENQTKPTEEEVNAKIQELQQAYNNKQYQRDRANAYESIEEQLDMMYWDKINGTNNWETMVTTVKNLYPKPTE